MGWKTINGHRYWYHMKRVGGQVVSEYRGGGETARLWALVAEGGRELRALERERRARTKLWYADRAAESSSLARASVSLARRYLEALGYREHKRQWRRRRGWTLDATQLETVTAAPPLDVRGEVRDRVDKVLRSVPSKLALWGLAHGAIDNDAEMDEEAKEAHLARTSRNLERTVRAHIAELAGPDPTAVELHLATTAGLVWLELRFSETYAWHYRSDRRPARTRTTRTTTSGWSGSVAPMPRCSARSSTSNAWPARRSGRCLSRTTTDPAPSRPPHAASPARSTATTTNRNP